ncbi:MAG: AAA family ATPase [Succinivibrionaceae bacterium]|nr:AAA family ATPase [Succinivibrionaceae bacterium]
MGTILNPSGDNSFIRLFNARNTNQFVDKTDFIRATNSFVNSPHSKFVAMTRGRGFGKTVMADMLCAYYSRGYRDRRIFQELKISEVKASGDKVFDGKEKSDGLENLNRFDVIRVDMKAIEAVHEECRRRGDRPDEADNLVRFMKCAVVRDLRSDERFAPILEEERVVDGCLLNAVSTLHQRLGVQFIFIMDDWDLIYRHYRDDIRLQQEFIGTLRGLFKSNVGSASFALAFLTGILPMVKEDSESGLNNIREINMLNPRKYGKYFGFTEEELPEIASGPCRRAGLEELRRWYGSYSAWGARFYNPRSIVSALEGGCGEYWDEASIRSEAARALAMHLPEVREDMERLLKGERIVFNDGLFRGDLNSIRSRNNVFALLVCLGYLSCDYAENARRIACIPNLEAGIALERAWDLARRTEARNTAEPS